MLRKLVADGEGVGDDRKVQQIATFFRESRKEDAKTSVPEAVKVTKALEFLELSMLKQKRISHMNKIHATECDQFAEEIDQSIEEMYKKMEVAKNELADAKIVKRNRQEYRKLVNVLEEVPSRAETTRKLGEVKDDLERQHERQKVLEAKLMDRRNHLQAFMIILSNFQRFCAEDDDDDAEVMSNPGEDDDAASVTEKQQEDDVRK